MIPFNRPSYTGAEDKYVLSVMHSDKMSGDGEYTRKCQKWFEEKLACKKALLTPSCTQALEMAAMLIDIKPGDEVIMPSYTFVSTANAFVLRGAKIVFVDIRPDTMNIDETLIEAAITSRTRAIVPVHIAGVGCEMDAIMDVANRHNLYVIEDAAHSIMSSYKRRPLGSIGHLAAYSFHETKNVTSGGQGGLLIVNDERFVERASIIREKGTDRSRFFRGMVDKYSWTDIGGNYLLSEMQAAYLWAQLERVKDIVENRMRSWLRYQTTLAPLEKEGLLTLPTIPPHCDHNAHMFYLKTKNLSERTALITHLNDTGILGVFHYVPLHSAPAGRRYGRFHGEDRYTTQTNERAIRLPMYYGLRPEEVGMVVQAVKNFYSKNQYEVQKPDQLRSQEPQVPQLAGIQNQ